MSELEKIRQANQDYSQPSLPKPPVRRIAIITCMDARLDIYAAFGLKPGDAHIIRNAGGLITDDAIRSLVISYELLGTREFYVVEHTDCGMLTFTNEDLRNRVKERVGYDPSHVDFYPFTNLKENLTCEVRKLRENPMIPPEILIHGLIYHVEDGKLEHVVTSDAAEGAAV